MNTSVHITSTKYKHCLTNNRQQFKFNPREESYFESSPRLHHCGNWQPSQKHVNFRGQICVLCRFASVTCPRMFSALMNMQLTEVSAVEGGGGDKSRWHLVSFRTPKQFFYLIRVANHSTAYLAGVNPSHATPDTDCYCFVQILYATQGNNEGVIPVLMFSI
jgi:hypothetical protein